jgi:phosphinothricin acetyltransferase
MSGHERAAPIERAGVREELDCGADRAVKLRLATSEDAAAMLAIYAPYVTGSVISFEMVPPSLEEMEARIAAAGDLHPWFVAVDEGARIAGYAYACAFRPRPAYRYAVETSVYLAPACFGRGIGRLLYRALLATLEAQGYAQAIAAITLPNPASTRLHESLGFAAAGVYRQVGWKEGGWHDVGLWQRPLAPPATPPAEPRRIDGALLTELAHFFG